MRNDEVDRLPRSVIVADNDLYREIVMGPDSVSLLEDLDAMVIPLSGKAEAHERENAAIREVLLAAGQLIPRALLVRNPYEAASYELAADALEAFASAKYHALANVARLLGAREVEFIDAKIDQSVDRWGANLLIRTPWANGTGSASNEVTKKLEKRLEAQMSFPGGEPAPTEALDYLRRRNLANDQQLRDLVEMRTGTNLISAYKMKFSGTRESAANLLSALTIANSGPAKAASVGGDFSKKADGTSSIEITTKITF